MLGFKSRTTSVTFFLGILALTILLAAIVGQHVFRFFNKTQVENFFQKQENFGIALIGEEAAANDKKNGIKFISIVNVYTKTKRIGFVSFYPGTKLTEKRSTIDLELQSDEVDKTISDISELLSIDIPYTLRFNTKTVAKIIDLIEGIPYFIWERDVLPSEKLPKGEFLLDGSIVTRLISPPMNLNEYSPAFKLFRHYSLILNLWNYRGEKWKILSHPDVMQIALKDLKSNLGAHEILFLGNTIFSDQGWLPLFLEVPVKRIKDDFVIDTEATLFYLKAFKKNLSETANPFAQIPPKMEIKNGTHVANLARELRNKFASKGVQVIEFANADHHHYQNSILIDTGANAYYLNTISKMTGIKKVYSSINRAAFTDLVLILGQDFKQIDLGKK